MIVFHVFFQVDFHQSKVHFDILHKAGDLIKSAFEFKYCFFFLSLPFIYISFVVTLKIYCAI